MDENKVLKSYHCLKCSETNQNKFSPKSLNLCRDCKLKLKDKKYACKSCGIENRDAFVEGRYSTCKFCRNKKKSEIYKEEKYLKDENFKIDKDLKNILDNYITYDYSTMDGYSIKQILKNLIQNDKRLILENSILREELDNLKKDMSYCKFLLQNMEIKVPKIKFES